MYIQRARNITTSAYSASNRHTGPLLSPGFMLMMVRIIARASKI
jgi:hypothetical protein